MQMEMVDEPRKEISVAELDQMVKTYAELRQEYETAKSLSNKLHEEAEGAKKKLIETLAAAGKSNYQVDGVGKVVLVESLKVSTPKDLEDKRAFWQYIESVMGEESMLALSSINHQTLQRVYNELFEASEDKARFHIPGLQEPTSETNIRFTKKR